MAYEDPRDSERERPDEKPKARERDEDAREAGWDSQDDGDYRYTDWASI